MKKPVLFNESTSILIKILKEVQQKYSDFYDKLIILRDLYGKYRFILDTSNIQASDSNSFIAFLSQEGKKLIPYLGDPVVLTRADFSSPDLVFHSRDIKTCCVQGVEFRLLDRLVTGQDWLSSVPETTASQTPRFLFHGIKGGVGRSTALAIVAFSFAQAGKKVLVLDLDFESPGLSGILQPEAMRSDLGIVDWIIESAVGQEDYVLKNMVVSSPLAKNLDGAIFLAPAYGTDGQSDYISKLSRIYGESFQIEKKPARLADKLSALTEELEKKFNPDVVLIDSRSGLHDLAAIGMSHLATEVFLFGMNNEQSWNGYEHLFSYWSQFPAFVQRQQEKLHMVYALFPERNREELFGQFKAQSYNLFSTYFYDEDLSDKQSDLFNFAENDENAPHYPIQIDWNSLFLDFTWESCQKKYIKDSHIESAFGTIIEKAQSLFNNTNRVK